MTRRHDPADAGLPSGCRSRRSETASPAASDQSGCAISAVWESSARLGGLRPEHRLLRKHAVRSITWDEDTVSDRRAQITETLAALGRLGNGGNNK